MCKEEHAVKVGMTLPQSEITDDPLPVLRMAIGEAQNVTFNENSDIRLCQ
jgi:hypothetical protein